MIPILALLFANCSTLAGFESLSALISPSENWHGDDMTCFEDLIYEKHLAQYLIHDKSEGTVFCYYYITLGNSPFSGPLFPHMYKEDGSSYLPLDNLSGCESRLPFLAVWPWRKFLWFS